MMLPDRKQEGVYLFEKFGENPPAYAIVIGSVTALAFDVVNIIAGTNGNFYY